MKKADIIAGIIGLCLSAYVIWDASQFPEDHVLLLGPSFFPIALAIGLALFSIVLIGLALCGKSLPCTDPFDIKSPSIHRALISLLASILYCIVIDYLGFIITSIVYLLFLLYLLKVRNYKKMLSVSIGVTIVIYGIFHTLLDITLPTGLF